MNTICIYYELYAQCHNCIVEAVHTLVATLIVQPLHFGPLVVGDLYESFIVKRGSWWQQLPHFLEFLPQALLISECANTWVLFEGRHN